MCHVNLNLSTRKETRKIKFDTFIKTQKKIFYNKYDTKPSSENVTFAFF